MGTFGDPQTELSLTLRPGERLLWSGRPDPAVRFTSGDLFLVPFGIMFFAFSLFWEAAVIFGGAPFFFMLWGIPFVAMGGYMLFGRFVYKRRTKLRTMYGLTNERILIAVTARSRRESPIKGIETGITRSRDGSHVSVTFGPQPTYGRGYYSPNTGMNVFSGNAAGGLAFYDVADADQLLAALETAQRG
jgi:hypothetical protein